MIRAKTYNLIEKGVSITDPDLAYANIFKVKREGIGYDTTDANRGYLYSESAGSITFSIPGNLGGERVRVIFETIGGPTPPACEPVSATIVLPDGVEGTYYNNIYDLTGTAPFTLIVNNKPSWMTILILGNKIRFQGTPDAAGSMSVDITLVNCNAGGQFNFTQNFNVTAIADSGVIEVRNETTDDSVIVYVEGGFGHPVMTFGGDLFPVYAGEVALGFHEAFTRTIRVGIGGITFPKTLTLSVNNVVTQTLPVTSDGLYIFASATYAANDLIKVILS